MSIGVKSGDRGGHTVGLPRTIHGPGNRQFRNSWTSAWQCAGVSSCYARLDLPLFFTAHCLNKITFSNVYEMFYKHVGQTTLRKSKKQTALLVPVKSPLCFFLLERQRWWHVVLHMNQKTWTLHPSNNYTSSPITSNISSVKDTESCGFKLSLCNYATLTLRLLEICCKW
jgi:hypothetical protein